jgi:hypothetical protein
MQVAPTQQSQDTLPSVWILLRRKPIIAATATKMAVQAPWVETAFRPIEMPSIPAPATKIQTGKLLGHAPGMGWSAWHTKDKDDPKHFAADSTEELLSDVVDAINRSVFQLEDAHHVIGPGGYDGNDEKYDNSGNHAESIKNRRDREDAQSDLGLDHQDGGTHPADLRYRIRIIRCPRSVWSTDAYGPYRAIVRPAFSEFAEDIIDDGYATAIGGVSSLLRIILRGVLWIVHVLGFLGHFLHGVGLWLQ